MTRAIIIVLDSVGIGELPDTDLYGDKGCNTLANIANSLGGLHLPNLELLGLGKIGNIQGISNKVHPKSFFGKMAEASHAKDTTVGHWEIAGCITKKPFPTYPNGFPPEIIEKFKKEIGRDILGNKSASGTAILEELGNEHVKTGNPIIYTSVDSVFQIAACEDIIPVDALYKMCEIARKILDGKHKVGRVIARPFVLKDGHFIRTNKRKDFSVEPPYPTLLDLATEHNYGVIGIGKIGDLFGHRGLTEEIHTVGNKDGIKRTIECIKKEFEGIIFTNLVDFDMGFGHRNDVKGYADALMQFDNTLPALLGSLRKNDILIITADHGCDPTTIGTDHTREYVPLLVYGNNLGNPISLGVRNTFADVGATVAECLNLPSTNNGTSFWKDIVCPQ
ncbi:MAG: phosphopentomutase [Candidatus Anammoxibacter sp.]